MNFIHFSGVCKNSTFFTLLNNLKKVFLTVKTALFPKKMFIKYENKIASSIAIENLKPIVIFFSLSCL